MDQIFTFKAPENKQINYETEVINTGNELNLSHSQKPTADKKLTFKETNC